MDNVYRDIDSKMTSDVRYKVDNTISSLFKEGENNYYYRNYVWKFNYDIGDEIDDKTIVYVYDNLREEFCG